MNSTQPTTEWGSFAPRRKTRTAEVAVFVEDDCTITARPIPEHPGAFVARIGAAVTLHGSFDTLARLAAEMTAAVEALRPAPTLDQFLTDCANDCIEGR